MAGGREVRIGERFKTVRRSSYGSHNGEVFEVGSIRVEGCVVPHAQIFSLTDPTDRKLISVDALRDTKLYFPVEVRNFELDQQSTQ
ncbi:MAG: hypothetical protein O2967_22540 [Proteobacteria bacterium]|nr:hypothetical protein [Pseudomonadota bacterium]